MSKKHTEAKKVNKEEMTQTQNEAASTAVNEVNDEAVNLALKVKSQRERDLKMIKGIVRNNELPDSKIEFSFRKYKEDPILHYSFKDGEEVEIPAMIANHINNSLYYEKSYVVDAMGIPTIDKGRGIPRFSFISTGY